MRPFLSITIIALFFTVFIIGCNSGSDLVSSVVDKKGKIYGKVMNNNSAIESATVTTYPSSNTVTTNINGEYLISDVNIGAYTIIVFKPGSGSGIAAANVISSDSVRADVAFTISTGVIYGKVTRNGVPVTGASVTTSPETVTLTTDNNGNYVIPNISQGGYTIMSTKSGVGFGTTSVNVSIGTAVSANVNIVQTGSGTVTIGSQIWSIKNLDVFTYRNGDSIPHVQDPIQWASLTTGAWCYYNNDPSIGSYYGKLYNWYAVNDPRGLAPAGWHIPTDAEWTQMTNFLGGDTLSGGKLKDTLLWDLPNVGATNSSGFSAYPAGDLSINGQFEDIGKYGVFWTSSEFNNNKSWFRFLYHNSSITYRYFNEKNFGFSVRCIKD